MDRDKKRSCSAAAHRIVEPRFESTLKEYGPVFGEDKWGVRNRPPSRDRVRERPSCSTFVLAVKHVRSGRAV